VAGARTEDDKWFYRAGEPEKYARPPAEEWAKFKADVQSQMGAAQTQGERGWIMENAKRRWINAHPQQIWGPYTKGLGYPEGTAIPLTENPFDSLAPTLKNFKALEQQIDRDQKLYDFYHRQWYPNVPQDKSFGLENIPLPNRPQMPLPSPPDPTPPLGAPFSHTSLPTYAEGGTPPVGEPAIVGEQGNVQLTPVDHDTPTMRAYDPTWRDRLAQSLMGDHRSTEPYGELVSRVVGSSGLGESRASALDAVPLVGAGLGIEEDLQRGRYGSAALDAGIGFLPFSKVFGRFVRDTARGFTPESYALSRAGSYHLEPHPWAPGLFQIVDTEGQDVGGVSVSRRGNDLRVSSIGATKPYYSDRPNSLGPSATRNLYRDLQAYYPYSRTLSGLRVSGARTGPAGKYGYADTKIPLNPDAPREALLPGGAFIKVPAIAVSPLVALAATNYDPDLMKGPSYDEYNRHFSPAPSGYAEGGTPPVGEPAIVGEHPDYDYEGARAAGVAPAANGHWPDTYKLPNHMTFSDESIHNYDGGAGHWEQAEGRWFFTPGPTNLKHHSIDELRAYFKRVEPDSTLIDPRQDGPLLQKYAAGYQSGGDPPAGQPIIVGEQGNVQLTPVDHDPFDDTLAQRAAHTIMALGRGVADWWHEQPSWLEKAEELRKRDDARFATGSKLNVRDFVMDPLRYELASGFGGSGVMRGALGAGRSLAAETALGAAWGDVAPVARAGTAGTPRASFPLRLYHGSTTLDGPFDPLLHLSDDAFGPHLGGTAEQANDIFRTVQGDVGARMFPLDAYFKNTIDLPYGGYDFTPGRTMSLLEQDGRFPPAELARLEQTVIKAAPAERREHIRQYLLDKGYDSVKYYNTFEKPSGDSYIPLARGTVKNALTGQTMYGAGGLAAGGAALSQSPDQNTITLHPVDHDPFN
jgi:hypothetical protein